MLMRPRTKMHARVLKRRLSRAFSRAPTLRLLAVPIALFLLCLPIFSLLSPTPDRGGDSGATEARMPAPGETNTPALPFVPSRGQTTLTTVQVYLHETGAIETMALEDYIFGVILGEMPLSYDVEALKAQAVAARSFTAFLAEHGGIKHHEGADVCTYYGHCQAFHTRQWFRESFGDSQYGTYLAKLEEAVYGTAGQILLYDGATAQTIYHDMAGGMTEDARAAFSMDTPYLRSVASPGEESASKYRTTVTVTAQQFADTVNGTYPDAKLSAKTLSNTVSVASRTGSGRVETLKVGGASIPGTKVRTLFSLRSAMFDIQFDNGNVVFTVTGNGHGVGMSQVGAGVMAKAGSTYQEILAHYYPGTQLAQLP